LCLAGRPPWRDDVRVSPLRSLLARALMILLLSQWGVAPAHCLAMAAAAVNGSVICHAGGGTQPHDGVPISPDQCCPACHALGQAALAPTPLSLPGLVAWWTAPPPPTPLGANPRAPRAPPQQPRAPPLRSV